MVYTQFFSESCLDLGDTIKYNELLKEKMKAKGKKEGRDFNVDETGKVEFEGYKYGYQEK